MDLIKCFKALSDKTRLRLFSVLQTYELNVNEIVMVVGMIQSGVSRHLKILTEAGLLTSRKEGSFTYFSTHQNEITLSLIQMMKHGKIQDTVFEHDLETAREMIHIRQNRTRRFFKSVAPSWDRLKKEILGELDLNGMILEQIPKSRVVCDLGCGTGQLIELLLNRNSEHRNSKHPNSEQLIGVDSSPEMLDQARKRLAKHNNVELRLGELEHLPVKEHEIDTAILNLVLHYISQPRLVIKEVIRVLKPGGFFILTDFEKHDKEIVKEIMGESWMGFETQDIIDWLTDTGFKVNAVKSKTVNHDLKLQLFTAKKI